MDNVAPKGAAFFMRFIVHFLLVLTLVTACSDKSRVLVAPEAAQIGTEHKAFVASLRAPTDSGWFGGDRAESLAYLDLDVAVPPAHNGGKIRLSYKRTDPQRFFTVTQRTDHGSGSEFVSALRDRLRDQPKGQRDVMLYVHGYNNSFADGVFRTVQLMHDFDLPGVGVHYSWPSAAHPLGYAYDRDSVLFARDGLEKLLRLAGQANPDRIILVGHSLGAMMVMETLRQIEIGSPNWAARHLGGVVLVSPDLDIEVFKQQAQRFARLPDPFLIFVSQKDRALQLSSQINGNKTRLGLLEDPTKISDLPVTVVDLSEFARNSDDRHFTLGTSPLLIQLLNNSPAVSQTFDRDAGGRMGLLPGTAITVQSATKIILSPLMLQN
jgi:esterase/lipase superfamily enzyme